MTIKFYLDKPKATLETAIYLTLRFGKSTLKFNTGKRIHPDQWNTSNPQNHFRKFTGSPEMNTWLNDLRADVNKLYYGSTEWTYDDLKEQIGNIIHDRVPKDTQKEFLAALQEFIDSKERNKDLAITTLRKYKTLSAHLKAFSIERKYALSFERVNKRLFEEFSGYLRSEKNHTNNTVNKYLKTLKTFINWAIEHEYTNSDKVSTKFKISDDDAEIIFLTWDELMSIYNLDLVTGSALDRVRDVFCFGCFTGQRFSDIANLKSSDIITRITEGKPRKVWLLHQIKVKDTIQNEIPLIEFAVKILDKYKDQEKALPVISNQKTNEHLKKLGEKAKIKDEVKIIKYRGQERIEIRQPKYLSIGSHTARRTFITLSLEMGMRQETVMAISGHSDYKTMKRYVAITNKMKNTEMQLVWKKKEEDSKKNKRKKLG